MNYNEIANGVAWSLVIDANKLYMVKNNFETEITKNVDQVSETAKIQILLCRVHLQFHLALE